MRDVVTNYTQRESTNLEGEINFPKVVTDSLIVEYIGHYTVRSSLKKADYIEVFIQEMPNWYRYFTDTRWKFKNGELYAPKNKETYKKK